MAAPAGRPPSAYPAAAPLALAALANTAPAHQYQTRRAVFLTTGARLGT